MKETVSDNLRKIASLPEKEAIAACDSSPAGLSYVQTAQRTTVSTDKAAEKSFVGLRSFFTPFTAVLIVVAVIALVTGILDSYDNIVSAAIIFVIILLSGIIQSAQNLKAHRSFKRVGQLSQIPVTVKREGILVDIPSSEVVEGDIVILSAGARVPADLRLVSGAVSVSQAAFTGESKIVKKTSAATTAQSPLQNLSNLLFYGSTVISGKGEAVVVNAGKNTLFGGIPQHKKSSYQKGAGSIVKVLLYFILFLVPVSLLVVGLTTRSFSSAVLFALSVAVGIVPEMLPLVISVCLSKGSRNMMKKKTLVRNVNTMQDFAGVDVLCVDKTGTLTSNEITLEYYLDTLGNESKRALVLSYLNAYFSTGAGNYIDRAILKYKSNPLFSEEFAQLASCFKKLDDLPFGYERKYSAVLVGDGQNKIILKGKIDEVLSKCSFVSCGGENVPMPQDGRKQVDEVVGDMLADGMKILAVAEKTTDIQTLTEDDVCDMTLVGFIVFFDAPKKTAKDAVKKLRDCAVDVVLLTGDDVDVALSVCKRIGIPCDKTLSGSAMENLSEEQLKEQLKTVKLFAELTPDQKVRIVDGLKSLGHTVGFLGDGMNDIPALCAADVAISVDTAEDAAKEVADVLLLEKDLQVLADGITEGRKICTNVQKYVKITASSNFGNVLALVIASIFFTFQPMVAGQLLLLNILYDLLCFTISFDNVDAEEITGARSWSGRGIGRFAVIFGIASTLFDLLTFVFLYFVICPHFVGGNYNSLSPQDAAKFVALFQTGWFLESLWTQTVILNVLRTRKLPFVQSRPSLPFLIVMFIGVVVCTSVPFVPTLNSWLGFASMPLVYFAYLAAVVFVYVAVILGIKHLYVKKFKELI